MATVSCFTEVASLTVAYLSEAASLVRNNCPEATSSVEQASVRHAMDRGMPFAALFLQCYPGGLFEPRIPF